jgi:hypothetical protein
MSEKMIPTARLDEYGKVIHEMTPFSKVHGESVDPFDFERITREDMINTHLVQESDLHPMRAPNGTTFLRTDHNGKTEQKEGKRKEYHGTWRDLVKGLLRHGKEPEEESPFSPDEI